MFSNLSNRLSNIFEQLKGRGHLGEADVEKAMRDIRVALLEADVALPVVKEFIQNVKEQAVGQKVIRSVTPGQMVVKIVYDELVKFLGEESVPLNLSTTPPAVILMAGLQGSGKTTSAAKLALKLKKERKKVLMASTDVYRPAAREQLEILGESIEVQTVPIFDESVKDITKRALDMARLQGYDVLIIDTAGRLHIDEELMDEIKTIHAMSKPVETLLVADAMTGQDAYNIANVFKEYLPLTGIVLTRIDGDARGGAALSMRAVTGCPIKFVGQGEKIEALDVFHPKRISDRILGMGDIVTLVERASDLLDQEEAKRLATKVQKGSFDLNDLAAQFQQMLRMGGLKTVMEMMPFLGKFKEKINNSNMDEQSIRRQIGIIHAMTKKERLDVRLLNASRKRRVAKGSGTTVQDVNRLIKQFQELQQVMKRFGKMGKRGMLRHGLKGLFS